MPRHWMAVIGLWCSVVLVFTGCGVGGASAGAASADVYLAHPRAIPPGTRTMQHVINGLGGGVFIVTGRNDEIAADVMATVSGSSLEAARIGAAQRITLTNDADKVEVRLLPEASGTNTDSRYKAVLHLAVPSTVDLPDISTHAGNVEVYGNVGKVTAVISNGGNIEIRGADGNIDLTTDGGSITADIMRGRDITLHAANGSIDLHAVEALVSAATTNGSVRFSGTLRAGRTHYFTTTAGGGIQIALPAYPAGYPNPQIYRAYVTTSASPINVEYPARGTDNKALPICGFIHSSGPYDYHVETTPATMGRIEVSPVVTGTYFFSGTLGTTYFRFDTNHVEHFCRDCRATCEQRVPVNGRAEWLGFGRCRPNLPCEHRT